MIGKGTAPDDLTAWDSIPPEIDKSKPNREWQGQEIGRRPWVLTRSKPRSADTLLNAWKRRASHDRHCFSIRGLKS